MLVTSMMVSEREARGRHWRRAAAWCHLPPQWTFHPSARSPQLPSGKCATVGRCDTRSYTVRTIIIGRYARGKLRDHTWARRKTRGARAESSRFEIEGHDAGAPVPYEENRIIGAQGLPIRRRKRIHTIGARRAALRSRKTAELIAGAEARNVEVKRAATEAGPIAKPGNNRRNKLSGRRRDSKLDCPLGRNWR